MRRAAGRTHSPAVPALFNTQDGSPGAAIEAQFKPFHSVLEGDSTRRPIDSIVANLNDIAQNLTLIIENPQMTAQATASLQTQVAALRNNASRMPPPFSDMLRGAAAEFEGSIAASTAGQLLQSLRDQVTPVCQQTVTNRYPFVRASNQEVPLGDFAKLFSPNGVIDKFFTQFLAPYADTSRPDWTWRKDSPVGRSLSAETLKQFQNAAYHPRRVFPDRRQHAAGVAGHQAAARRRSRRRHQDRNRRHRDRKPGRSGGAIGFRRAVTAAADASAAPTTVQWPGPSARTAISVSSETGPPSVLERIGPWSLFRMLEAGSLSAKGETASASFIVAGHGAELSDLDRIGSQSAQSGDTQGVPLSQWNLNTIMRCGLFGKLGAKRDFIALATPRSFLEAWEPWVQSSLSASRHQLGDRWQQAFLTAPVWRFWLGAEICGTTVAGRDHAVARWHGALLSAHAACDCGRRRSDSAARNRYPGRVVRHGRELSALDARARRQISTKSRRRWTSLRFRELDPAPLRTRASCRSVTTWREW